MPYTELALGPKKWCAPNEVSAHYFGMRIKLNIIPWCHTCSNLYVNIDFMIILLSLWDVKRWQRIFVRQNQFDCVPIVSTWKVVFKYSKYVVNEGRKRPKLEQVQRQYMILSLVRAQCESFLMSTPTPIDAAVKVYLFLLWCKLQIIYSNTSNAIQWFFLAFFCFLFWKNKKKVSNDYYYLYIYHKFGNFNCTCAFLCIISLTHVCVYLYML